MLAAMRHRGPDARGVHVDDAVALGCARLAIIDLHGGDQPIFSEDGSVCAVYNGEIYNYRELQQVLRARGHRLRSATDSEVLVHLYEDRGPSFVDELNGMFAFALWDGRLRQLHLGRDRLGIKPLYYTWDGTTLAFASELKALLAVGQASPTLDLDAFVELLTFQNIASYRSLFRDVRLLPPGYLLRLDDHGLETRPYWDPLPAPDPRTDVRNLAPTVAELFDRGVKRQLVADVEVASYLSGGLDTGAIATSAASQLRRLTTFSTGFDVSAADGREAEFDERGEAAQLAAVLGTHHHELLLDADDMEMVLPRLVLHLEEPRMSFSYPNFLTAGAVSRWVKVVLSGVGGDELFGGYPWRYQSAGKPDFAERYFTYWNRLLDRPALEDALTDEVRGAIDLDRPRAVFETVMEPVRGLPDLDRALYFETKTYLHGLLLLEDKMSMAHSLESRVPFLDHELVDFLLTVPAKAKLSPRRSKDLFRSAMSGRLPEPVVARRKTGFTPPQAAWFRGSQSEYVDRILLSDRSLGRGLLRPEFLRRTVAEHRAGRIAASCSGRSSHSNGGTGSSSTASTPPERTPQASHRRSRLPTAEDDSPFAQTLYRGREVLLKRPQLPDPFDELRQSLVQAHLGLPPKPVNAVRVMHQVAYVAGTKVARRRVGGLEPVGARQALNQLDHRYGLSGAHVEHLTVGARVLHDEHVRPSDVADEDVVTRLSSVLVHGGLTSVEQQCRENRHHSGVRVEYGLPGSEGDGIAEGDGGDAHAPTHADDSALLRELADRVRCLSVPPRVLIGERRHHVRAADRTRRIPVTTVEAFDGAPRGWTTPCSGHRYNPSPYTAWEEAATTFRTSNPRSAITSNISAVPVALTSW